MTPEDFGAGLLPASSRRDLPPINDGITFAAVHVNAVDVQRPNDVQIAVKLAVES